MRQMCANSCAQNFEAIRGGFCCPAPPRPRLSQACYVAQLGNSNSRHSVISINGVQSVFNVSVDTYKVSPITVVLCRAKTLSLLRTSILIRPHLKSPLLQKLLRWRRRVPPPGPFRLCHNAFIAIAVNSDPS